MVSDTRTNAIVRVGRLTYRWVFFEGIESTGAEANVKVLVGYWCRLTGRFTQMWLRAFTDQPLPPKGFMSHYREMMYDAIRCAVAKLTGRENLFVLNINRC